MRAIVVFLQDALKVRPEEFKRTGIAFFYLFCTIGAFITSRITKSGLFLEIPNYREQLPLTYIGISITVSLVMTIYSRFERKLRRDQTNTISLVVIAVVTLGFRQLLNVGEGPGLFLDNAKHEVYWAFFIWVEVLGTMLIVQFWSLIPEIFNSRQAKRLFAIIGGGGVLANIAFGFAVHRLVPLIGTENLLYLIVACLTMSAVFVQLLSRDARTELSAAKDRAPSKKKNVGGKKISADVFATRHVQLIAAVIVLTYLVSTMVDYQFNVIVADSIPGKDDRSAYFASFFFYTGIIGGVIQFTMTSRILEKFGVLFALLLLPCFMLLGTMGLIGAGAGSLLVGLWAATATKGSENVLRYTVNDSTLQLLYLPVPSHIRGRAKAVIDGVLKPVSVGMAGFIMAVLVGQMEKILGLSLGFTVSVFDLGYIVGAGLLCWALTLVWLRREYLKSLMQTLHRRRLNFADASFQIADEGTIKILEEGLASDNVGHLLHSLELLPHVTRKAREPLQDRVVGLLSHESDEVRVAALSYLSATDQKDREEVTELLDDAARDVRAAAILAYCAAHQGRAIERIQSMLDDRDRNVQAAAVAGLIRYGGLDGVLACADYLKRWLTSEDAEDRQHAAWVLGEVGVENFYQPLIPLLADDSEKVRLNAVHAAGKLQNPELIEPLLSQLGRPRLAAASVNALAAYGLPIESRVAEVLNDGTREPVVRTQACRVLGKLGDKPSCQVLTLHLSDADPHIRAAAAAALMSIADRSPSLEIEIETVTSAIKSECRRWFEMLALAQDLQLDDQAILLSDALGHRRKMAQTQILALLALKYSRETIDLVARNLQSKQATTAANAVEVLDNMLDKDEKAIVLPVLEEGDAERKLQTVAEVFAIGRETRERRLSSVLEGGDPWLQSCAALEVGNSEMRELRGRVRELLKSESSVCRETAIVALKRLSDDDELRRDLAPLEHDPAPTVQRYARFVLA